MTDLTYETGSNAPPPPIPLTTEQVTAYLDYEGVQLEARRAELIDALHADASAYTTISDEDTLAEVMENVRLAGALARVAEERRKTNKAPFKAGGDAVDVWFKRFAAPLSAAVGPVQALMDEYGARKLAKQRAAAEAKRVEAQREADRLARIAAERMETGRSANAALEQAAAAAAIADAATAAVNQRAAATTQTRSVYGAVGSVRESWAWEVADQSLIPPEFMMPNGDAIREAGKDRDATGKPIAVIPGIRWVSRIKVGVR